MRAPAWLVLALAAAASGCTVYHQCTEADLAQLTPGTPPRRSTPVRYRVLPTGVAEVSADYAVFTHASQYQPAPDTTVDFEREQVVRIRLAGDAASSIAWIAETTDEVLVSVFEPPSSCTAYPSSERPRTPTDLAIPLTTKPVRLRRLPSGPSCQLRGQG